MGWSLDTGSPYVRVGNSSCSGYATTHLLDEPIDTVDDVDFPVHTIDFSLQSKVFWIEWVMQLLAHRPIR